MSECDKKLEMIRLTIYLVLAFAMAWAVFFAFILTGHKWDGSNSNLESFTAIGMLAPLLAHVLTRMITKEGFAMTGKDSMMVGIGLKDKKWIFYLFAMIAPWIYFETGHALNFLFYPATYDPERYRQFEIPKNLIIFLPILSILQGTIISVFALGEEGSWRGYMMPKLIKLIVRKKQFWPAASSGDYGTRRLPVSVIISVRIIRDYPIWGSCLCVSTAFLWASPLPISR